MWYAEIKNILNKHDQSNFRTQEMCNEVVHTMPKVICSISDCFKTQDMCKKVVQKDQGMLKYVPDLYRVGLVCSYGPLDLRFAHKTIKIFLKEHVTMLRFGHTGVTTKDFFGQRQTTAIFTIDLNKVVVISDEVPCNNGKDFHYIVGYQADGVLIPLFIKTPKDILSYGVSQYDKNSAYTISFNVSEEEAWKTQYKKIWNEIESQLFEKMATESIKIEGRYVNDKLKTWKERIKTNFHGQDVPYNMHCNATAVLKIDSVNKQGKNYHPQVYVEECKYIDAENQQCSMLSIDDNNNGFFEA